MNIGVPIFQRAGHVAALLLLCVAGSAFSQVSGDQGLKSFSPTLSIYAIDVGQGDSALVIFPDDSTMLIDTGTSSGVNAVIDLLSRLSITHLDKVVVTHTDGDHDGGYPKLQSVGLIDGSTQRYDWSNTSPGDIFYRGGNTTVTCVTSNGHIIDGGYVNPGSNPNGTSVGVVVKCRGFDYLSCGDLEDTAENALGEKLAAGGWKIDVLKVDHHGSNSSSPLSFLQNVLPEFAVIMVGHNSYGHPTQGAIDRLNDPSVHVQKIFQTETGSGGTAGNVQVANGQVHITTDGATYTVANEGPGSTTFSDGPYAVDEYVTPLTPHLIITEVTVAGAYFAPEDNRWVELYCPPGAPAVNLSSLYWVSKDQKGRLAESGSLTMQPGDVAVVHKTSDTDPRTDESDATGKGANGWWDLYTHLAANHWITTEDRFIVSWQDSLTPDPTKILDAVIWSNRDGTVAPSNIAPLNYLITGFHWGDPGAGNGLFSAVNDAPGIGPINSGYAQRRTTEDTDSLADWVISTTPSEGTPPPTPTSNPTPSPTPAPPPPPKIVRVQASPLSASSGGPFDVSVEILPVMDRPFDAYAVILGPGVVYSIRFGNSLSLGVSPIAQGVSFLPAGYYGTLLEMTVPPGVPGDYQAIIGLADSGAKVTGVESAFAWDVAYFSVR
ncbi:MAG: MBL fold metallo-hydrolase [Chlamydiota bacterium]